jgi:hypothetical protein
MALAISGTYMTFLQTAGGAGSEGPFLVISDDSSVVVDGIKIKNPAIASTVS